jgi:hypothetical protein
MPEEGASRKQQIPDRPIPTLFEFVGAPDFGFQEVCVPFVQQLLENMPPEPCWRPPLYCARRELR